MWVMGSIWVLGMGMACPCGTRIWLSFEFWLMNCGVHDMWDNMCT